MAPSWFPAPIAVSPLFLQPGRFGEKHVGWAGLRESAFPSRCSLRRVSVPCVADGCSRLFPSLCSFRVSLALLLAAEAKAEVSARRRFSGIGTGVPGSPGVGRVLLYLRPQV